MTPPGSDLLLSIATAQWKERDARAEIHELVDELNGTTAEEFAFDKDFVLKSSLVLADIPNVGFKVRNFTRDNMAKIESDWPKISGALRVAVGLASSFGYSGRTLTAGNALIPIAYYLLKRGLPSGFIESRSHAEDRERIRDWLVRSLLKRGVFGFAGDSVLRTSRAALQGGGEAFPVAELESALSRQGKSLRFAPEEIDELLDERYGRQRAFSILALLYPGVDFRNKFHEDHIYPRARFTRKRLRDAGVPEEQVEAFLARVDCIPNLQLLEGIPNQEKSAKMPAVWLHEHYSSEEKRAAWRERNYVSVLPEEITGFLDFYESRAAAMRERLLAVLRSEERPESST